MIGPGRQAGVLLTRRQLTSLAVVLVVAFLLFASFIPAAASQAEDDDAGGTSVSVEVTEDPTPTLSPPSPRPDLATLDVTGASLHFGDQQVAVGRNVAAHGVGLVFTRGGYRVEIWGRDGQGVSLPVDSNGNLIVDSGGSLFVKASGFQPGTPAAVYLYSTPTLLGQLTTDSAGSFSGSFAIPPGTSAGVHQVQVVGTVETNQPAVLTAGLLVYAAPGTPPSTVTQPVNTGGTSGSSSGGATVVQTPVTGDGDIDSEPGTLNLGIFSISALRAVAEPSLSLTGGAVNLSFTVRNNSASAFDADARFWLTSLFGQPIGAIDGIPVADLQPNEVRRVAARFESIGNWVFYRGYVTFTPPEVVDNTELQPVTREAGAFVPPPAALPVIGLVAFAALVIVVWLAVTGRLWFLLGWRRDEGDDDSEGNDGSASAPSSRELVVSGASS
ncbi:hypothetical protein [Microbacterium schleiferi]|uniref:Carboxypeptidase regulatory-like domain-containing protein n=1 Tax=Microbacterium schleiferi TaxID=69362 RepID=A0ABU7V860_9MICO